MSVYCCVGNPDLLRKTLSALVIQSEGWATLIFTPDDVMFHVEGSNQSMTATAVLPRQFFSEYSVAPVSFTTHLPTLLSALTMSASANITLAYTPTDGRLVVELGANSDEGRLLQSQVVTRPVGDSLLNLRFKDAALSFQVVLVGDVVREAISDISAAQCPVTVLTITATHGVLLEGVDGPFGDVQIQLVRGSEVFLGGHGTGSSSSTRVLTDHLALATAASKPAVRRGKGGAGGGAPSGARDDLVWSAAVGGSAGSGPSPSTGFERVTLQINAQRQLSVIHTQHDHNVKANVTVVVMPVMDFAYDAP
ncbi:cell cycle checkpoint protein [Strigomonas culicis]|uniref:Cell cycle checkpoint protein n=1 Tax=Strigomonas culicis TaxID=28005 RepID=S9UM78_9TRYP|nr:cell cycle checkpoint protein [Strigomonas culicis]EPY31947.1 cell cycle checkpoint protein [Strigomonas culicis]|eukprot:EPY23009.1 cell cycle checkpoint protein [Strigomonas culicis]